MCPNAKEMAVAALRGATWVQVEVHAHQIGGGWWEAQWRKGDGRWSRELKGRGRPAIQAKVLEDLRATFGPEVCLVQTWSWWPWAGA